MDFRKEQKKKLHRVKPRADKDKIEVTSQQAFKNRSSNSFLGLSLASLGLMLHQPFVMAKLTRWIVEKKDGESRNHQ